MIYNEENLTYLISVLQAIQMRTYISIEEVEDICGEDCKSVLRELEDNGIRISPILDSFYVDLPLVQPLLHRYQNLLEDLRCRNKMPARKVSENNIWSVVRRIWKRVEENPVFGILGLLASILTIATFIMTLISKLR